MADGVADFATLGINWEGGQFEAGMARAKDGMQDLGTHGAGVIATIKDLGKALAEMVAGAEGLKLLAEFFEKIRDETSAAQYAQAQLAAAVKSTGGAAGVSVAHLNELADALEQTSIYSHVAIEAAEGVLLTFQHISGTNFDRTAQAMVNLAARMGGDVSGAALKLGKALENPVIGMSALQRSGIVFSEAEKDVIKHLAETNQLVEAQNKILDKLDAGFGGAAEAARNTLGGALAGLKNEFNKLFEVTRDHSSLAIDAINNLTAAIKHLGEAFGEGHYLDHFIQTLTLLGTIVKTAVQQMQDLANAANGLGLVMNGLVTNNLSNVTAGAKKMNDAFHDIHESAAAVGAMLHNVPLTEMETHLKGVLANGLIPWTKQTETATVASAAYAKALAVANTELAHQRALNAERGPVSNAPAPGSERELVQAKALEEINQAFALKAQLQAVDLEQQADGSKMSLAQAAALKAVISATADAAKVERDYTFTLADNAAIVKEALALGDMVTAQIARRGEKQRALNDWTLEANRRTNDATAAEQALLDAQQDQITLMGLHGEAAKLFADHVWVMNRTQELFRSGVSLTNAGLMAQAELLGKNTLAKGAVDATHKWLTELQSVVGIVQLIASAFGDVGKEIAAAATGAQSIMAGLQTAQALKARQDAGGAGATGVEQLGVYGAIAGGLLQLGNALGALDHSQQHAQEKADALSKAFNEQVTAMGALTDAATDSFAAINADVEALKAQDRAVLNAELKAARGNGDKIEAAFAQYGAGLKNITELEQARTDALHALHAQILALAKANEALGVRELRSSGDTAGADLLAFDIAQREEAAAAADKFKDAAYNARLATEQLAERTAYLAKVQTEAAAAAAEAAKVEAARIEQERRTSFDLTNGARGFSDPRGAAAAQLAETEARRLADATDKAAAALFNMAEAADAVRKRQEQDVADARSAEARIRTAYGDTRGGADLNRLNQNTQEQNAARASGMTPENFAALLKAQFAEGSSIQMQRAVEDGTKTLTDAANKTVAGLEEQIRQAQAAGDKDQQHFQDALDRTKQAATDNAAMWATAMADEREHAKSQLAALDAQAESNKAREQLAREQVSLLHDQVAELQKVSASLDETMTTLRMGDLSPSSPSQKLDELRAQFNDLATRAAGGETGAAGAVGAAAIALLEQQRNASGSTTTYADEASRVQGIIAALQTQYGGALGAKTGALAQAQAAVDAAQAQAEELQRARTAIQDASEQALARMTASAKVDADGFRDQIAALELFKEAAAQGVKDTIAGFQDEEQKTRDQLSADIQALTALEDAANKSRIDGYTVPQVIAPPTAPDVGQEAQLVELRAQVANQQKQLDAQQAQTDSVVLNTEQNRLGFLAVREALGGVVTKLQTTSEATNRRLDEVFIRQNVT